MQVFVRFQKAAVQKCVKKILAVTEEQRDTEIEVVVFCNIEKFFSSLSASTRLFPFSS